MQEMMSMRLGEELLHLLPNLMHLVIGYIGPEFPSNEFETRGLVDLDCCSECTSAKRTRQYFHSRSLYHNFSSDNPLAVEHKPDMLIALNSGHAHVDTQSWRPTLEKFLSMATPAVFTCFHQDESMDEAIVLASLGAHFMLRPELNRWKSLLPRLDSFAARYQVFYQNFWWYIINGRN